MKTKNEETDIPQFTVDGKNGTAAEWLRANTKRDCSRRMTGREMVARLKPFDEWEAGMKDWERKHHADRSETPWEWYQWFRREIVMLASEELTSIMLDESRPVEERLDASEELETLQTFLESEGGA